MVMDARPPWWVLGFELFHFLGQCPEGAIDIGVLVDAADFASAAACYAAACVVALDVGEASADHAFLGGVERVPDRRGGVFAPADGEHLVWGDGCRLVTIAGNEGGGGKGAALALSEA